MKRLSTIIAFAVIFLMLAGCTYGSFSILNGSESNTGTSMSMTYDRFNGYKATTVTVKEDEAIKIKVEIISDSGELGLTVMDENEEPAYQGNNLPTSSFSVFLDKQGKYEIKVNAKDHTGSYRISWGAAD